MDKKEFREFVIKSAKKYIFEGEQKQKPEENIQPSCPCGNFKPDQIKTLAEEMKKINKKIDLRNPLISPELFDIISEDKSVSEEKTVIKEDQNKRWQNLYSYNIPEDDNR